MKYVLAFLLLGSATAFAQSERAGCGDTKTIEAKLAKDYGEHLRFFGAAGEGRALVRLYANESSADATWTLTMSPDASTSCLIAAGKGATMAVAGKKR